MLRNRPAGSYPGISGPLSPILVRQSVNRCRLLLPITGVASVQSQALNRLFDYSSLPPVGQLLDDHQRQNCVGRTDAELRVG
jgi:hypothetical protein